MLIREGHTHKTIRFGQFWPSQEVSQKLSTSIRCGALTNSHTKTLCAIHSRPTELRLSPSPAQFRKRISLIPLCAKVCVTLLLATAGQAAGKVRKRRK